MRSVAWIGVGMALCALVGLSASAEARRSGGGPSSEYYEWQSQSRNPVHGYSGWVPGGRSGLYCDYQRIPNRECTTTSSGKRRCRATSWTLKQYCY